ncbi:MAG: transcriptional regulator, partial [Pseudomonadota bacterium]
MKQNINHHLTDSILMGYAAGTLPEAFNLMVATHVSLCDECRARLEGFEAVGGAVLEQRASNEVAMDEGSLAATLSLIAGGAQDEIRVPTVANSVLPGPLQSYVGGDLDDVQWRAVGMG